MATIRLNKNAKTILECIHSDLMIKDIVDYVGISRAAVDVHIKRLMKMGLVQRLERGCPYEVTKDGENYID